MDDTLAASDMAARFPPRFPPPFADAWGDDAFGLWANLAVWPADGDETVVQRFRWIEAGTFLMGSPEDEAERWNDESPQHLVTISRGFWLGDTACTQALWQAVIGENPSRFKGADRPVETVRWIDVQRFLERLGALLPGGRAELPTEAEWEYACRAGTTTQFSLGNTIKPDHANYRVGRTDRVGTVAVGSLPPNPWGLYEMHGNVLEWCADGLREYEASSQQNPRGPEGREAPRACRGGSWISGAKDARSASRNAFHPRIAFAIRGFRLCLRSVEPAGIRSGPEGR